MALFPRVSPAVELRDVGDEVLVHDTQREQIHVLNATAGWILRACDGKQSLDEISKTLATLTSEELGRVSGDVERIVTEFGRLGVVTLHEGAAT